ncbi:hypothetical protein [Umezawaea beigongshangensis]|uniref:hypothetical protein n=1 Tax=Umezawaea beigongshangensis TaxID=2780383 RepID=UPI0018F24F85|nr:hypothetical protein [Umezawaea beigongshangensis]
MLLVSHDLRAVCARAHEIVVLDRGRVAGRGRPADPVSAPGSPAAAALVDAAALRSVVGAGGGDPGGRA